MPGLCLFNHGDTGGLDEAFFELQTRLRVSVPPWFNYPSTIDTISDAGLMPFLFIAKSLNV
jgi:hypothetical protein